MEFTGERFIPGCGVDISFEHYHRYVFAGELVEGKKVLDLACGEGYGAAMLSRRADHVIGVDVDERAVEHANGKYAGKNLEFKAADCADLGQAVEDHSIDVVVFFEAIEHMDSQGQARTLKEIKRVLKRGGVLAVSTPNKDLLVLAGNPENEYHVHEMTLSEFKGMLEGSFTNVAYFGQRFETGDIIWPDGMKGAELGTTWNVIGDGGFSFQRKVPQVDSALFFLAVCSDGAVTVGAGGSILLSEGLNVQIRAARRISMLEDRVKALEGRISEMLDSNSWRITAPLRWLRQTTRRSG